MKGCESHFTFKERDVSFKRLWTYAPRNQQVFLFKHKKTFFDLGLSFLAVTSQWGHVFAPFWLSLPGPWAPNQRAVFYWLKSFWYLRYHPSFGALDWLSSMSGSKIMAQQLKIGYKSNPQKETLAILAKGHPSPVDWARELFKPSEVGESLVVTNKNFVISFGCRFYVDIYMMRACLWIFVYIWMTSSPLGGRLNEPILRLNVFGF